MVYFLIFGSADCPVCSSQWSSILRLHRPVVALHSAHERTNLLPEGRITYHARPLEGGDSVKGGHFLGKDAHSDFTHVVGVQFIEPVRGRRPVLVSPNIDQIGRGGSRQWTIGKPGNPFGSGLWIFLSPTLKDGNSGIPLKFWI